MSIYKEEFNNTAIISSDTIVVIDNKIIGKPKDKGDAFQILKILSNREHRVLSGIAIHYRGQCVYDFCETKVYFEKLSENEINLYLNKENYMDKAGAYAIQGLASVFIKKIDGCFFNVMGFPLNLFNNMLKRLK